MVSVLRNCARRFCSMQSVDRKLGSDLEKDMISMNLSIVQIAEACGGKLVMQSAEWDQNVHVSSVVLDSRQVTEGGVFVATVGERVDGHRFIPDVFAKGVSLVISEKTPEQVEAETGAPAATWGNYLLVESSFGALKDIAESYRKTLSIPIVGITGSVGKTSTKEAIAGVLSEKYNVLKTEGNFNNEIGVPLTLLRIREEHEVAVVEMGINQFGEMHRLSKMVRPNVCVITNIGQCHLENLGTRDGILQAKSEIFDFMAEDGEICLNGDDDKLETVTGIKGKKPHFFGLGENPMEEVYATEIVSKGLWGSDAILHMRAECNSLQVHIPLPGRHMVINAAAAACVGKVLGLTEEQIVSGISKTATISGRNNLMRLEHYTLIDDCYNANPVSMKAAINLLQMADTETVAILGDMFELGTDSDALHAEIGAYAVNAGIDRIYCVGENARHMYEAAVEAVAARNKTLDATDANTVAENATADIRYFATRELLEKTFLEKREELAPYGSTILLKASHGMAFEKLIQKKIFE